MRRAHWFQFFYSLVAVAILLNFQMCSNVDRSGQSSSVHEKSEGNGGSYGGKPSGTYYRYVSNYRCGNQESPRASVNLSEPDYRMTSFVNMGRKCEAKSDPIVESTLDISRLQSEVIGLNEVILQNNPMKNNIIPDELVEVWCKDDLAKPTIEVIVSFNRTTRTAQAKIFYQDSMTVGSSPNIVPPFPIARTLLGNQFVGKSEGHGFLMEVNRDRPGVQVGFFESSVHLVLNRGPSQRPFQCRLGGALDTSVWPSLQLTQPSSFPQSLGISPDGRFFSFISGASAPLGVGLFIGDFSEGTIQRVSDNIYRPAILGGGLPQAFFSLDSTSLYYRGWSSVEVPRSLIFNQRLTRLDEKPAKLVTGRLYEHFSQTKDLPYLIYEEDLAIPYRFSVGIRSLHLTSGLTFDLSPPSKGSISKGIVKHFGISNLMKKAVYIWSDTSASGEEVLDLYSVNFDGTNLKKISPKMPSKSWRIASWNSGSPVPNSGSVSLIQVTNGFESRWVAVAVDGTKETWLPLGWDYSFFDNQGASAILFEKDLSHGKTPRVIDKLAHFDLRSGQLKSLSDFQVVDWMDGFDGQGFGNGSFNLSITTEVRQEIDRKKLTHPSLFFFANSRVLVGRSRQSSGKYKVLSYSIDTGASREVCSEAEAQQLLAAPISEDEFVIATYNQGTQILDIFHFSESSGCRRVNSIFSHEMELESLREIVVAPDRKKVLLRLSKSVEYKDYNTRIYFITLDGTCAYQVNTPLSRLSEASHAIFSGDSKSVIYLANQVNGAELSVFMWKIPTPANDYQ